MMKQEEKIMIIDSNSGNFAGIAPKRGAMLQELMLNNQSIIQTKVLMPKVKLAIHLRFYFLFQTELKMENIHFKALIISCL